MCSLTLMEAVGSLALFENKNMIGEVLRTIQYDTLSLFVDVHERKDCRSLVASMYFSFFLSKKQLPHNKTRDWLLPPHYFRRKLPTVRTPLFKPYSCCWVIPLLYPLSKILLDIKFNVKKHGQSKPTIEDDTSS